MENNEFYSTIFKRKSIRNFDLNSLKENELSEISNYLQALKPMYKDIKTEIKIVGPDNVKRRMMKKAPHYIAIFSEVKEGYLTNIGFMLQQLDLFLSRNGIASCWQGIPAPKKELVNSSNLKFVIFMAFGKPQDPETMHRSSIEEFKRKQLKEITEIKGVDELLEAVRIAPSAANRQPWFFTGTEKFINAYASKSGFARFFVGKYPQMDVGIALYHLKVSAEHFGSKTKILLDETARMNVPNGTEYIASMKLE
jgi:nitroreductase